MYVEIMTDIVNGSITVLLGLTRPDYINHVVQWINDLQFSFIEWDI